MPNSSTMTPGDREPRVLEHRGVAEDRQAERQDEREERRRRQVDAVPVAVAVVGRSPPRRRRRPSSLERRDRAGGRVGAAGREPHEATLLVLGVLAVPEVVARVDLGISAKLYSGTGDGIDHSSVRPSHGSARRHLAAQRA